MIDIQRRRKFAELLRHFFAGSITNDDFQERVRTILCNTTGSQDPVLSEIDGRAWWCERWIMFLFDDLPYRWPPVNLFYKLLTGFLNLLAFGWWAKQVKRNQLKLHNIIGDESVWPYSTEQECLDALKRPLLLGGSRS